MFKIKQLSFVSFLGPKHERIRFLSPPSSPSSMVDSFTQHQQFLGLQTQNREFLGFHCFSFSVDPEFYISTLVKCRTVGEIKQIHAQTAQTGLTQYLPIANKLLNLYSKYNALDYAYPFFDRMEERDSFSWSVMVGGFAKSGDYDNCLRIFREAVRSGVRIDNYSLPFALRACRDTSNLQMGRMVHHMIYKSGMHLDSSVLAAAVDMYVKCGVIEDARKVFDNIPKRNLVIWTVMIYAYAESGDARESLLLFDQMMDEGILPDKVAMVTVVYACAKSGAMNKAKLVHDYISRKNFSLDVILGTALIDMYAKCGCIDAAKEIFDAMRVKNVVSWSVMIAAYGYHGRGRKALELFSMMLNSGISPNRVTFVSLLYACSHAGLVDEGRRVFSFMWEFYSVRPDVKHYTCMVDLLGRAGRLDEALELINSMRIEKDSRLWAAMLGACRIHGNIELAEKAAQSLLELHSTNPGHYVLLSNIYAKAGKWEDVAKMRELMARRSLKKIPGWTWIEVENKIHQFSVGDNSHPRSQEIQRMLKALSKRLELIGYVPDTNFVLHDVDEELKEENLYSHSEKLAIAFGLISTPEGTQIRITKNLRICGDCHTFCKLVSLCVQREVAARDANRFHHFKDGACSCGDYW